MKKIFLILSTTLLTLTAQTFNVSTTPEFRTALQNAAGNGEDDTIILADGTYTTTDDGQGTFQYLDNEVYDLTLKGSSAENVILDGNEEHRIFRHNSIDRADLYLEKLTFANGGYENYTSFYGGGFLVVKAAVTINDCNFTNNQAYRGGGFDMGDTPNDLNITNTVFENNVAGSNGGGGFYANVYAGSNYTTIKDSKFINNSTSGSGGGFSSVDVTVENSLFYKNKSNGHGGGFYTSNYVEVSDCNFTENGAYVIAEPYNYREGGGFYSYQSGSVNNSIFVRNTAGLKGGGLLVRGSLKILNTSLIGNRLLSTLATAEGAGLCGHSGVVSNCIIKNNHTYGIGGGLSFYGVITNSIIANNYAELRGGGVSSPTNWGNLYVSNTIFSHNNTGIALYGGTVEDPNIIKNSVFVDINDSIMEASSGEPIVSIKNNYINSEKISSDLQVFSSNNIYNGVTLGFVDQANEDYHLTVSSNLIDVGTNDNADKFIVGVHPTYYPQVNYLERDLDDNNRSVGANMDMGAYEYSTTKPTIIDFTFTGEAKEYNELTFNVTYNLTNGRAVQSVEYDYMNDGNFETSDTHTYTEAKTYTVHARVTDDVGESSFRTISVQIENLPYEDMTDEQKLKEAVDPQYYLDILSIINAATSDAEQSGQQYVIDNPSEFNLGDIQEIEDGCRANPQSCGITPTVVVIPL